jgi:hypothetical protein
MMNITTSIVVLKPGMYVLRHPKGGQPALTVTRAPGTAANNGKLELLATSNTHGSILRDGGDCIVMYVSEAPVELAVSAYLSDAAAAVPALRIDQIALDSATAATGAPAKGAAAAVTAGQRQIQISDKGVSIIAHIERTGDMVAGDGAAVGDPAKGLRVEGFQVMWPDRPAGADLSYSINVEGMGQMPAVTTGKFCGTRGQARRITELNFTLVGPDAAQYALEGTAWFTGGFQLPISSGSTLGGPSGLEHLTALSLKVVPATAATGTAGNPWTESATTKVFKAKAASPAKPAAKKRAATSTTKARKA